MAVVNMLVSNPTAADITTNSKTAKANAVTSLAFDDAALVNGYNDLVVFLNAGCAAVKQSPTGVSRDKRHVAARLLGLHQPGA